MRGERGRRGERRVRSGAVQEDVERRDRAEEDVSHAPEDGPLRTEEAGPGGESVRGGGGGGEVDEEGRNRHERLGDGVS